MPSNDLGAERRTQLGAARLYMVCRNAHERHQLPELPELVRGAIAGGVDIIQLREKDLAEEALAELATASAALCAQLGALFIVNDRPEIARDAGADGVHVGQDDMPVAEVREIVGRDMLIGLSTHAPGEIDAVDPALVDYIGVGPIHETPTKPGRPAVGLELIRYAAAHATVPFFAIGGLHAGNVAEAIDAGASRLCILRAISDAADPERAARELRDALEPLDTER
jgi:thiamine-phosphate pyrophosphorylase